MRDHQNIGKQDRCIETETPDGLKRHLRRHVRIEAKIEEAAGFFAHGAVFRQIAPGLPHHP